MSSHSQTYKLDIKDKQQANSNGNTASYLHNCQSTKNEMYS